MSSTQGSGAPPSYAQISVYPSAPPDSYAGAGAMNPSYAGPPYPSYQDPAGPQYPCPPYPTFQQSPYPPPQPGYSQPQPANYTEPGQAVTFNSPYGAQKYEDDEGAVNGGESVNDVIWAGDSFSNKKLRRNFIKKVYLILMTQLSVTFGVVAFFLFCQPVRQWVQSNNWFYYCAYGVFLVTYITLVCCDSVRRRWPSNIICLAIFTLAFSYMAGTISSFYSTESVLIALGITAAVCLAISLFAIQTKIDFTMCSGLLFALCMTLMFFGLACMIFYLVAGPSRILQCVYGGLAALVFSLFLVFDTQMVVVGGQKRKYELSAEEHIYGALQLYLDIVYLFLIVLSLFGGARRS